VIPPCGQRTASITGGGQPQLQELVPKATAPEAEAVFATAHQCAFWATIEGQVLRRYVPLRLLMWIIRLASPSGQADASQWGVGYALVNAYTVPVISRPPQRLAPRQ
jgi:hypothetical protein